MPQATPPTASNNLDTEITTVTPVCDAPEYPPCADQAYSHDMREWFKRIKAMRSKIADSVHPFAYTVGENDFGEYIVNPDGPNKTTFTETDACNCSTAVCSMLESPVQNGITLEGLKSFYKAEREAWIDSQEFADLRKVLEELLAVDQGACTASENAMTIGTCVAMGLGSFSGRPGEVMRLRSMQQLVFFVSMVEIISAHQPSSPPELYAQEPHFNDLDRALLSSLGITTVNHPTGFNKMTRNSFAYCPGAEQIVDLRTLIRDPKIYVGAKLETWTDNLGRLRSHYVSHRVPKGCKALKARRARAKGPHEPKDDVQATQPGSNANDNDDGDDDDGEVDWESLVVYNDCAKHNAEFVKIFMESGRTRYDCPPLRYNSSTFLIWRDDTR